MSRLPKSMELDRQGIERLPVPEAVKVWFRRLVDDVERNYEFIREQAESVGAGATSNRLTQNWKAVESGSNLDFRRDTTGAFPASTKKAAVTG